MKHAACAAIAMLALAPVLAAAHGPSRQKIAESVAIPAPPDAVWAVIGNFHDMSWHPAVHATAGEGGNAIDATRILTLGEAGGPTIAEVLYKHADADRSYSYRITAVAVSVLPVTNYASTLSVLPGADGGSVVEWRGAFYRGYPNNDPPPGLDDDAAVAAVGAVYRQGLDALAARFGATQ